MDQTSALPVYVPLFQFSTAYIPVFITLVVTFCGAVFYLRSRSANAYRRFALILYWAAAILFFGPAVHLLISAKVNPDFIAKGITALASNSGDKWQAAFALTQVYQIKAAADAVISLFILTQVAILLMWLTAFVAEGFLEEDNKQDSK